VYYFILILIFFFFVCALKLEWTRRKKNTTWTFF